MAKYQDLVIKDGKFVGRFEEMYQQFDDPWEQSTREEFDPSKSLILNSCEWLRERFSVTRAVEIGCGFGGLSQKLLTRGFKVTGTDVSPTSIRTAKERHPDVKFTVSDISDYQALRRIDPEIIIMSEITWYILPELKAFLVFLREEFAGRYLVHTLSVYEKGSQKYGREYFTDLPEILDYFNLDVLESGVLWSKDTGSRTFFSARIPAAVESRV